MEIKDIEGIFLDRKSKAFDIKNFYAVMVPLIEVNDVPHLLYQVRSSKLRRQPGEISFPGGRIEEGETSRQTAVRETREELGIDKENVQIMGELDYILDSRDAVVYPMLGILKNVKLEEMDFCKEEVAKIFTIPIDYFINHKPEVYALSYKVNLDGSFPFHKIKNRAQYQASEMIFPTFFYEYNKCIIWGLTAKITRNFIKELRKGLLKNKEERHK